VPGTYKYSYYAEGGTEKGEFYLKKSGGLLVLKIDKGKLKNRSKFAQNIFVSFSGKVPIFYGLHLEEMCWKYGLDLTNINIGMMENIVKARLMCLKKEPT
jgi:hypothetical protein